jgi:hypothetical protein
MAFKLDLPNILVGFGFSLGGVFVLFGAPPIVAVPLTQVNNLFGQNICPEGQQRMFYPGDYRVDRCIPEGLLRDMPCYGPADQMVTLVEHLEAGGAVLAAYDTMCAPRGLNLPRAIRQPLIPTPKPVFSAQ